MKLGHIGRRSCLTRSNLAHLTRAWQRWAVLLFCTCLNLSGQELSLLGGAMNTAHFESSSYSWQVDYHQDFYRNLAASVAYINEGHLPGHHRDGTAIEAWGRWPFAQNRFSVSVGLGVYYYFDTQQLPSGETANIHGTAPILSVAATGYLSNRWLYRLMLNRIHPAHEMKVNTAVLGVGYWFGQEQKPTPGKRGSAPDEQPYVTENELTVFGGQSVVNTYFSEQAHAFALEYRRGLARHIDWTTSVIYEGDPGIVRRSGLATQVWAVNSFFNDRVTVGIGLGPYVFLDRKHPLEAGRSNSAFVAALGSLTIAQRFSEHWLARLVFDRVTSSYNRDADVFLLGVGYRWQKQ